MHNGIINRLLRSLLFIGITGLGFITIVATSGDDDDPSLKRQTQYGAVKGVEDGANTWAWKGNPLCASSSGRFALEGAEGSRAMGRYP